jgi:hypothetical protein
MQYLRENVKPICEWERNFRLGIREVVCGQWNEAALAAGGGGGTINTEHVPDERKIWQEEWWEKEEGKERRREVRKEETEGEEKNEDKN